MTSVSPSPLIALLSSPNSQQKIVNRGFKSFAHFVFPFTTHDCQIREPVENSKISSRVRLDIRDISNDGHLLTLSVLPYVLIQALKSNADVSQSIKLFRDLISRWSEPSEHESFGHYLACIFVVSSQDENPLGELSKMIQTQQTLYNTTSTLTIPPHCSTPKWASAHTKTPRYYILLHDSSLPTTSTERRDEIFAQMCATYGNDKCQILQLNSRTESPEMKGVWDEIDELNDVLGKGLDEAVKHSTDSAPTSPGANGTSLLHSPSSPSSVSTISSIMPAVGSVSPNSAKNSNVVWKSSTKISSLEDGKAAQAVIDKFLTNCLVPHVEREMRNLYDTVSQRKGIGKAFSGMRKWFPSSSSSNLATPITYAWDSSEMQMRRLGDLFMMFGSPGSAYDQYLQLKRDFENDKAMTAHAIALEMCVVALHAAQPNLNSKQFPIRYLETPVGLLLEHAKFRKYPSILRCAFNVAEIYADLGLHKEAAATLARISTVEGDHLVAVSQALAAEQFEKAGLLRKASFHRVLAANRFSNAKIPALSFDCYRLALPTFDQKHWGVLDEHLAVRLLEEGGKAGVITLPIASECIRRLVAVCPKLSPALQADRLRRIIKVVDTYFAHQTDPVLLLTDIPKVEMSTVKVVCGERPLWEEIDENEHQSVTPEGWITVERAAHYSLFGASTPYRGMQLVSDEHSDNHKIRETPVEEPFRVMVDLTNTLKVPLDLQDVQLSISDVHYHHENTQPPKPPAPPVLGTLANLHLEAEETKTIQLYVFPHVGCVKFRVSGLLFRLKVDDIGVSARVPLECRGKRLNKTAKQQKSKTYAHDERLHATVSQKAWPLVEFRLIKPVHKWSYCDQAQRCQLEIKNIGHEDVVSMCLATNAFDRVAAGIMADGTDEEQELKLELAANNSKIATFLFQHSSNSEPFLKVGETKRVFFDIRSASEPTGSSVAPKTPATVVLISYKSSEGTTRQWRRVIDGERRRLVAINAEILDFESRIFALHIKNCVAISQAALSRVQILRVRTARNEISTGEKNEFPITIAPIPVPRKIEMESEQSDTLVAHSVPCEHENNEFWLTTDPHVTPPKWPSPAEIVSAMDDDSTIRIAEKIGVLWKANIVDNEGVVTPFIGESFIDDPFTRKKAENKLQNATSSLRISCETETKEKYHDFSTSRICELPATLHIQNNDSLGRVVSLAIKYLPKVAEAVDGIHLVAPENRHQMWMDRPVRRCQIKNGETANIGLKWKITHAAVYDLGGTSLTVEAQFQGTDETILFKVPSVLLVVKSSPPAVV